jgi:hypothetical protein
LAGSQRVIGSNPIFSTKKQHLVGVAFFMD